MINVRRPNAGPEAKTNPITAPQIRLRNVIYTATFLVWPLNVAVKQLNVNTSGRYIKVISFVHIFVLYGSFMWIYLTRRVPVYAVAELSNRCGDRCSSTNWEHSGLQKHAFFHVSLDATVINYLSVIRSRHPKWPTRLHTIENSDLKLFIRALIYDELTWCGPVTPCGGM